MKACVYNLLFCFFFLHGSAPLFAQPAGANYRPKNFAKQLTSQPERLHFQHLGIEEGLGSESVTSILQDSKGYLWFGTFEGLYKYDGYTFTKYQFDPFDPASLSQNTIYTIWEDRYGYLWVSSFEGMCKFDRTTGKFTRYKPKPNTKFSDPNISAINEDSEGTMWVGTHSGGLCRFDRKTGQFFNESFDLGYATQYGKNDLHDGVNCLYRDRSGTLWVGNRSGLHKIELHPTKPGQPSRVAITHYQNEKNNPNSISNNVVGAIAEDKAGLLWIATENGLNSFDPKTGTFKHFFHDPKNKKSISTNSLSIWGGGGINEDQNGNLWICTAKGLNKLNKERTIFTTYLHNPSDPNSISSNVLSFVAIDKANTLWAGSWDGKLNKANLNNQAFRLIRHDPDNSQSLSNNLVTSILEDKAGALWIGTYGGGLNRWDKRANEWKHFVHIPSDQRSLRYNEVHAILEDRHGHLWVSNGEMLSQLNKQTGRFTHYNSNAVKYPDEDHRTIFSLSEDKEGLLWLGTGNGLKSFNEKTGKFVHYYFDRADTTGISDFTVLAVFADSRNNIWIGHGSIATDRLNKQTGRFTPFKHDPQDTTSISSNIVRCFLEDAKGNIWMGTSAGGLCRFDPEQQRFSTMTTDHGLPGNTIFSIAQDDQKRLWLGTGDGLSCFDPVAKTFTNYDYKDGLQGNVFAAGHRFRVAACKGKDGMLYFGGSNGFNYFNTGDLAVKSPVAPVVITQFKLFDRLVQGAGDAKKIVLNHDQNYFSFEFSSLSFSNPPRNRYAYKLEGVDKDWIYSGSRRYVSYTNIEPGTYTFQVKATNSDGLWNEKGTSVIVVIHPPWWRTGWAYALYGLLFLCGVYAVHRFQKQRVVRKEREKARVKELAQAREIEKAYTVLRATQQQLIQQEKMASLGELTAGIAHEIQNPLNFINNFSEANKELLQEMKEELQRENLTEVRAIAGDLEANEEKISHHGRRADSIVKGMLQHSRQSTGKKEPTDLNRLVKDYLRLGYQGARAKDSGFTAIIETHFDNSIGNITVVPQDLGRVLLNLFNNAFYAVSRKKEQLNGTYEPVLAVSTKRQDNHIFITVRDNGTGIAHQVKEKVFQPFFTTKPTGEGTGLGLSLSYDIITKGHGGEIKVESREGEGTAFTIMLPLEEQLVPNK